MLKDKEVRGGQGRLGLPVARSKVAGAQRGAAKPALKCKKLPEKTRRFHAEEEKKRVR